MDPEHFTSKRSPLEYSALIDAAKVRAIQLRREAIRDFWLAVARGARCAWHTIRRHVPTSRHRRPLET
jgi:hypothetical protein